MSWVQTEYEARIRPVQQLYTQKMDNYQAVQDRFSSLLQAAEQNMASAIDGAARPGGGADPQEIALNHAWETSRLSDSPSLFGAEAAGSPSAGVPTGTGAASERVLGTISPTQPSAAAQGSSGAGSQDGLLSTLGSLLGTASTSSSLSSFLTGSSGTANGGGLGALGGSNGMLSVLLLGQLLKQMLGAPAAQGEKGTEAAGLADAAVSGNVGEVGKSTPYDELIEDAANRHGISASLVKAVMQAESDFDPNDVSDKGAMGLLQLMPETAREMGVTNPFDPKENIEGGVGYLAKMLDRFQGDTKLALAAYNAGPRTVEQLGIGSSADEAAYSGLSTRVRAYVDRVMGYEKEYVGVG